MPAITLLLRPSHENIQENEIADQDETSLDHFKNFEPEIKTELLLKLYTQQTHKLHKFSYNLVATTLGVFLR